MTDDCDSKKRVSKENAGSLLKLLSHHAAVQSSKDSLLCTPDSSKVAWRNIPDVISSDDIGEDADAGNDELGQYGEGMLLDGESDVESGGDSDTEALQSAGVWTDVETVRVHLMHLNKLKHAYLEEFEGLRHQMRENRRRYLQEVAAEHQSLTSIHRQPKDSVEERLAYARLKALRHYRRHHGREALLREAYVEKRSCVADASRSDRPGLTAKDRSSAAVAAKSSKHCCLYNQGSWKCGEPAVPLAKYCVKHILEDPQQQLYRACGVVEGGSEPCSSPIIPLPHLPTCLYHTPVPRPHQWGGASAEQDAAPLSADPPVLTLTDSASVLVLPDTAISNKSCSSTSAPPPSCS
ncbi:putative DNA-binding domain [Trinorchestia longiramus]|nr:putative DNA-binding domain [Trinorchestia longiramus]